MSSIGPHTCISDYESMITLAHLVLRYYVFRGLGLFHVDNTITFPDPRSIDSQTAVMSSVLSSHYPFDQPLREDKPEDLDGD